MPSFSRNAALHIALPLVAGFIAAAPAQPASQPSSGKAILVTPDNFARAESDLYFGGVVKNGGFGKFDHTREPAPIDKQTVIRLKSRHALLGGGFRS